MRLVNITVCSVLYFGLPSGHYLMFYTLMSTRWKKLFCMLKNVPAHLYNRHSHKNTFYKKTEAGFAQKVRTLLKHAQPQMRLHKHSITCNLFGKMF